MPVRDNSRYATPRPDGSAEPQRRTFSQWRAAGVLPDGLTPVTVAAAHIRASGGRPAARDLRRKQVRAYSKAELAAALQLLTGDQPKPAEPPPQAQELRDLLWSAALARVVLPSNRMMFRCECRLLQLTSKPQPVAQIAVRPRTLHLVDLHRSSIITALSQTLQTPVEVQLVQEVEQ